MTASLKRSALQVGRIRLDLENLYHYANFIEKSLEAEVDEIQTFVCERGHQPTVDEELWNVTEIFPHLHRSSAFLTLFAFFEHNLNAVCDSLAHEHGRLLRVTDLGGRGIERAKIYISKEIGIVFPSDSESWRELRALLGLRNILAHRDGFLKPEDDQLHKYIERSPYVSIAIDGRIKLHEGVLIHLLDHLELFFKELGVAVCA